VALTRARRTRAALPSWALPALAGAVTLWGLTGLSFSYLGPWIFLGGAAIAGAAVVRDFLQQPRG
jgi:hypothetical protein